jgi:hypothetical protein
MRITKTWLFVAQGAATVLVAVSLWLLPGASPLSTLAAMAGVWGVVAAVYRRQGVTSPGGWLTLLAAATALAVGLVANVYVMTGACGGDTAHPALTNFDVGRYFQSAQWIASGGEEGYFENHHAVGYSLLIAALWKITGVTIVAPMVVNMLLMLLTVVMAGTLTRLLLSGVTPWSDARLTLAGMVATVAVTQFFFSGAVLLKEALTGFCLVASALAVKLMAVKPRRWWAVAAFVAAAALLAVVRDAWIALPAAFAVVGGLTSRGRRRAAAVSLVSLAVVWAVCRLSLPELCPEALSGRITANLTGDFLGDQSWRGAYYGLLRDIDYFNLPFWRRLLWLPVTSAMQFLVPLPWHFARDAAAVATMPLMKISYPWYLLGGLILYYLGACLRRAPRRLSALTAVAVFFWLCFAWLAAGTMSRYAAALTPLLAPAAVYVAATSLGRRGFRRWAAFYAAALAVALVSIYFVQQSTMFVP